MFVACLGIDVNFVACLGIDINFVDRLGCRHWGRKGTCCPSEFRQPDGRIATEIWKVTRGQSSNGNPTEDSHREPTDRGEGSNFLRRRERTKRGEIS